MQRVLKQLRDVQDLPKALKLELEVEARFFVYKFLVFGRNSLFAVIWWLFPGLSFLICEMSPRDKTR